MSLPPEKASELKQLIHQQLSKVRRAAGPGARAWVVEPLREGELRSVGRRGRSAESSAPGVERGWETEAVVRDFQKSVSEKSRGEMSGWETDK